MNVAINLRVELWSNYLLYMTLHNALSKPFMNLLIKTTIISFNVNQSKILYFSFDGTVLMLKVPL